MRAVVQIRPVLERDDKSGEKLGEPIVAGELKAGEGPDHSIRMVRVYVTRGTLEGPWTHELELEWDSSRPAARPEVAT